MIETYWNDMFGEFKGENGKFDIPGFPEPLMSAHFGVKNIIGPTDKEIKQSFKLCQFSPLKKEVESISGIETLEEALKGSEFWNFQDTYNKETSGFMKRLLPFLISHSPNHFHLFMKDSEGIHASAIIGVAGEIVFLFNLSVKPGTRKQGRAKNLINQIRGHFPEKSVFYWTVHPWFTNGAEVMNYHLLT